MANNEIMNFIQHYKSLNLLWDTSDKNYNNKLSRRRALGELSREYNLTIPEVKQKIKNLRSYFSKEYHKCKKSEDYVSGWFAYEAMLFLKDGIPDEDLGSLHHQNAPSMSFNQPKPGNTASIQNTSNCNILKKRKKTLGSGSFEPPRGDAYGGLMGRVADILTSKDEFSSFGDMISFKLRRLSPRNQAIAQNRISNLLFELEMDELHMSTVQSSPVVSNTNSYSEESGSVVYGTQQANESSHTNSMYVNTVCKVAMNQ